MADIRFYDKQFLGKVFGEMENRLDKCSEHLKKKMQANISVPTATSGPSRPGEFPHMDTNELRSKLFWQRDGDEWTVGSPTPHGRFLEENMNRPWCQRTLEEQRRNLRQILLKRAKL